MHYRLGWPLGRMFARIGVPTIIRIDVFKDDKAGVFVGTSVDLRGLVLEADTFEELKAEAHDVIPSLLDAKSRAHLDKELVPSFRYTDGLARA